MLIQHEVDPHEVPVDGAIQLSAPLLNALSHVVNPGKPAAQEQVLEQVRQPPLPFRIMQAASPEPQEQIGGQQVRRLTGQDLERPGQGGDRKCAAGVHRIRLPLENQNLTCNGVNEANLRDP